MYASQLLPGTVVSVRVAVGLLNIDHVGMVTDRCDFAGNPTVLSASKKRGIVAEESWFDFSGGAEVTVEPLTPRVDPLDAIAHGRSLIGRPWTLWDNCEHFVRECLGYVRQSPQLQQGVAVVGGLAVVLGLLGAAVTSSSGRRA